MSHFVSHIKQKSQSVQFCFRHCEHSTSYNVMIIVSAVFLFFVMCGLVPCNPRWNPVDTSFDPSQNLDYQSNSNSQYAIDQQTLATSALAPPIVSSPAGPVQGFFMNIVTGRKIFAFEGIPYGEPPVGYRRFRPSILKRTWTKILTATRPGPECLQLNFLESFRLIGSEDCLYLNVYTPKLRLNDEKHPNLPVIVFSHPGANTFGAGSLYGPAYLLARNVIFITFNYRLGIFGFATSGDEACPGNLGIKDHITVLEWVQKNIYSFGGDPSRVTVMGQSGGAYNVHLLFYAPKARPLFHAGITMSGNAFAYIATKPQREIKNLTQTVAQLLYCPTNNSWRMIECMRQHSGFKLLQKVAHFGGDPLEFPLFTPVIESANDTFDLILKGDPEEEYYKGAVQSKPLISGITRYETLLFLAFAGFGVANLVKDRIHHYAPKLLYYEGKTVDEYAVTEKIVEYYLDHPMHNLQKSQLRMIEKAASDRFHVIPQHKTIQLHSQLAPTYPYIFDFRGKVNVASWVYGFKTNETGPTHIDDLIYVANSSTQYPGIGLDNPKEMVISRILCNLFVNFASTLKPSYTMGKDESKRLHFWPEVKDPQNISFLHIGQDKLSIIKDPFQKQAKFWESLNILGLGPVRSFNGKF